MSSHFQLTINDLPPEIHRELALYCDPKDRFVLGQVSRALRGSLTDSLTTKEKGEIVFRQLSNMQWLEAKRQRFGFATFREVIIEAITFVKSCGQELSSKKRGWMVVGALQSEHPEIVDIVLDDGPILEEQRGQALIAALHANQPDIAQTLLKSGPISEEDRHSAIRIAAQKGEIAVLQILINTSLAQNSGRALALMEARGDPNVVNMLIENGPINEEFRGVGVCHALLRRNPILARTLLEKGPIHVRERGMAVKAAAENGLSEMVQILLNSGPISERSRNEAVRSAAMNGHMDIMPILQAQAANIIPFDERSRGAEVLEAVYQRDSILAQTLLENGAIRVQEREGAVEAAAGYGLSEMVQILLNSGPISEESRNQAVQIATRNRHMDIVPILQAQAINIAPHGIEEDPVAEELQPPALPIIHLRDFEAPPQGLPPIIHLSDFERDLEIEEAAETRCPSVARTTVFAALSIATAITAWCVHHYIQSQSFGKE